MTEERQYAIYREGDENPIGTVSASTQKEAVEVLHQISGKKYWAEEITPEQAIEINQILSQSRR